MSHLFRLAILYWHTVRHLKAIQLLNRITRRMTPRWLVSAPRCRFRERTPSKVHYLSKPESILSETRFRLLNRERDLEFPEGWSKHGQDRLWGYHLHYFDGLHHPGTPAEVKTQVVHNWIAHNPLGTSPGWEPYPLSVRACNWMKWMLVEGTWCPRIEESLALQLRFLETALEYHLLANHLLVNAKALVMGGLLFGGAHSARWYKTGISVLSREVPEQFLGDGAHFELSPTYHSLLLEDLLDLIHTHEIVGASLPLDLRKVSERALQWLSVMTRPDGSPPLFNDAAYHMSPTLDDLTRYAERLGLDSPTPPSPGVTPLLKSGYVRFQTDEYVLFCDVGEVGPSYQPGHAHCDMLSFELSVQGRPLLVDTGTSTYEPGDRRTTERGTAAHNTVQFGELEQSEIWGSFRVARRAVPVAVRIKGNCLSATCRGFPPAWIRHHRTFEFHDREIRLNDEVQGGSLVTATARFHFHPGEEPRQRGAVVEGEDYTIRFEGADKVEINSYEYAPEFNRRIPAQVLEVEFRERLITEIAL